jgi:hypothetical protein
MRCITKHVGLLLILSLAAFISGSCSQNTSQTTNNSKRFSEGQSNAAKGFATYAEAMEWVRSNPNLRAESVDASRSSFIRNAEYYGDKSGVGFLILNFKGKEYIFEGVPKQVWQEFRNAPSFGQYYNQNIRGRYGFRLGPDSR